MAKALAATTMGIITAVSAALSAGVSMLATNAVAALSAMGSEVGLGAAMSGVGLDGLIHRLQYFTLLGELAAAAACEHEWAAGLAPGSLWLCACLLLPCTVLLSARDALDQSGCSFPPTPPSRAPQAPCTSICLSATRTSRAA